MSAVCKVMLQEPGKLTVQENTQERLSSGSLVPLGAEDNEPLKRQRDDCNMTSALGCARV